MSEANLGGISYVALYGPELPSMEAGSPNYYGVNAACKSLARLFATLPFASRIHLGGTAAGELPNGSIVVSSRAELFEALGRLRGRSILLHDLTMGAGWAFALRAHIEKTWGARVGPTVVLQTAHSISYMRNMDSYLAPARNGLVRPCDVLVSPSEAGARALENMFTRLLSRGRGSGGSLPNIVVIPHPIERPRVSDRDKAKQAYGVSGKVVFLCFSRISDVDKANLEPLLVAMRRIVAEQGGENAILVIAGWDPHGYARVVRDQVASFGLGNVVIIVESPNEEQKRDLFAAADCGVFLADSVQETYGLALREAMASGLACVASRWSGYREALTHDVTGLLSDVVAIPMETSGDWACEYAESDHAAHLTQARLVVNDPSDLATCIRKLLSDPDRRSRLGRDAQSFAEGAYSESAVRERYVAAIASMVNVASKHSIGAGPRASSLGSFSEDFAGFCSVLRESDALRWIGPEAPGFLAARPEGGATFSTVVKVLASRASVGLSELRRWFPPHELEQAMVVTAGLMRSGLVKRER